LGSLIADLPRLLPSGIGVNGPAVHPDAGRSGRLHPQVNHGKSKLPSGGFVEEVLESELERCSGR
jgi:hypothetical protein